MEPQEGIEPTLPRYEGGAPPSELLGHGAGDRNRTRCNLSTKQVPRHQGPAGMKYEVSRARENGGR